MFKWRIYSEKRIQKVVQLIQSGTDDQQIAAELLIKSTTDNVKKHPLFRIKVEKSRVCLEYKKYRGGAWYCGEYIHCDYDDSNGVDKAIKHLKEDMLPKLRIKIEKEIVRENFKPIEIKL